MPTYQYRCTECGGELEAVQKFTDDPLTVHEDCGGRLRKVFSPVGIVFKGSGFYRNDSRAAQSSATVGSSASGKGDSGKGDSGKSDSGKSEAAKPAASAAPAASSSSSGSSSSTTSKPATAS